MKAAHDLARTADAVAQVVLVALETSASPQMGAV